MKEETTNKADMQLRRIDAHPLEIKGNYIVADNLECGYIEVFLHTDEDTPLYIQSYDNATCIKGATLVGNICISVSEEDNTLFVPELYYKEGHEELRKALVNQIMEFANFYGKYENIELACAVMMDWVKGLLGE